MLYAGGGGGGGIDTNLDVPPLILNFHNYIHRICSCMLYLHGVGGGGGSLYPLSVTTTDLLSVRGFTALSAIHKECCVISVIRTEKWLIRYRY